MPQLLVTPSTSLNKEFCICWAVCTACGWVPTSGGLRVDRLFVCPIRAVLETRVTD
jgi:hypothetical protein